MKNQKTYPFNEGDRYWTIVHIYDHVTLVESIWNDISEESYDENPNRICYSSIDNAIHNLPEGYKTVSVSFVDKEEEAEYVKQFITNN